MKLTGTRRRGPERGSQLARDQCQTPGHGEAPTGPGPADASLGPTFLLVRAAFPLLVEVPVQLFRNGVSSPFKTAAIGH